jgi:hypothetical protein
MNPGVIGGHSEALKGWFRNSCLMHFTLVFIKSVGKLGNEDSRRQKGKKGSAIDNLAVSIPVLEKTRVKTSCHYHSSGNFRNIKRIS